MASESPLILVLEDDPSSGRLMHALLEPLGCRVVLEADGAKGLEWVGQEAPSLVFLDLGLADMHGLEVLEKIKDMRPQVPVIVLTADMGIPSAVKAIQLGAVNYFTKPIKTNQVLAAAKSVLDHQALLGELHTLRQRLQDPGHLVRQMGGSPAVLHLQDQIRQVAGTNITVLVQGETGAGKEVVARAIHDMSPRSHEPFIALDCGAIPDSLMESELFGYERGAFSGADRRKEGQFQLAHGGTLFLDEIANLPLGPQAKLLRVLQERQLQPLGGQKPVAFDVRIVAASNHDLEREVQAGRFRHDLFFRLAEFRLNLPALRERPEDIPFLAQRFLDEARIEFRKPLFQLESDALELLSRHRWPGNVRELRNVIRQSVLLCQGPGLAAADLERVFKKGFATEVQFETRVSPTGEISLTIIGKAGQERAEREAIGEALRKTRGNILAAARSLKVDNKTLHVKLKRYAIRARDFSPVN